MKTTHEGTCECCEAKGMPARVTIVVEHDRVEARCETHGPWPWMSQRMYDECIAVHRAAVASSLRAEPEDR